MLKHTPFHDFHVNAGGKMVDFAGWDLPILYKSIVDEHHHTRNSGSIFDVSHMGRVRFSGPDALKFLDTILTRKIVDQKPGVSRYSLVCNDAGGVLDDVIVSRDSKDWLMVCNASNREKLLKHFREVRSKHDFDFDFNDQTESTAMIALQGPKVIERLADILPGDLRGLKRYHFYNDSVMLVKFSAFRSGYTGEDGIELILGAKMAAMAMKMLAGGLEKENATIRPAGLGARDTLRLEAGMPLYGHELLEDRNALCSGLNFAIDLSKDFIGATALRDVATKGPPQKLVGLELEGKRIARQGSPVLLEGKPIGEITSGTLSPTLGKSIAMAYIDSAHTAEGTALSVDLKGTINPGKIVKLPFYKRP
ncbi:MAG TPA: glycine cleavage system aminomethyltransferase GcvT [Tepidisphaeraceae bacterium]|nr:glycine cleavage system aminomethyltransferase GcvT [Tepidisphaeraceae bacterium]